MSTTETPELEITWPSVLDQHGYNFTGRVLYRSNEPNGTQVGLFYHNDHGWVVVKSGLRLEYEYKVGRRAHELVRGLGPGFDIIAKSIAWFGASNSGAECLVMEYVEGQTVDALLCDLVEHGVDDREISPGPDIVRQTLVERYFRMIKLVIEFERRTGFTHYDLHLGNIITNDDLVSFKLIDFGYAHLQGIGGIANLHDGALGIGVVPTIQDPWIDIARLIVLLYSYLGHDLTPEPLGSLLLNNGFSPWCPGCNLSSEEIETPSWISIDVQCYPGAELIPGIEAMYAFSSKVWTDGFPVNYTNQSAQEIGEGTNRFTQETEAEPNGQSDRGIEEDSGITTLGSPLQNFVDLMTHLKQRAIQRRLLQTPDLAVILAEEDIAGRLIIDSM